MTAYLVLGPYMGVGERGVDLADLQHGNVPCQEGLYRRVAHVLSGQYHKWDRVIQIPQPVC